MSDRRYRQRGYQDDGGGGRQERRGPPQPPREKKEGPRGRGLGAPTATVFRCAVCGTKQDPPPADRLDAACRQCGTALHSCTHCAFFDTSAPNECAKPVTVRILAKAKANACTLFEPKTAVEFAPEAARPSDAKSAFDALFKF